MKGTYKIADIIIEIDSLYPDVHRYCADYRCEGEAQIAVKISQSDIEYEREKSRLTAEKEGRPLVQSSDGYLEELAVYRKIAEKMTEFDTFLFHGSCVAVDGVAYLFTACSGTGKSTHAALWRKLLGERAVMVNDDKPLIRVNDKGVTVFGTPYNGKHRLGENISAPLKAIAVLERARDNFIKPVTAGEIYPKIVQQTYRSADGAALARTLALTDRMLSQVSLYRLGCNMDIEAAQIAFTAMSKR